MRKFGMGTLAVLLGVSLVGIVSGCNKTDDASNAPAAPKAGSKMSNGGSTAPTTIEPVKPQGNVQP